MKENETRRQKLLEKIRVGIASDERKGSELEHVKSGLLRNHSKAKTSILQNGSFSIPLQSKTAGD